MPQVPAVPPVPPLPALPAPPAFDGAQLASLEVLQARAAVLREQVKILEAQTKTLARQLRSREPEVRASAQEQIGQVAPQLANAKLELASVMAQLDARDVSRSGQGGILQMPPGSREFFNAGQMTAITIVFTLAVLMPIALGLSRRLWRRVPPTKPVEDVIGPRLDRLEHAVDAIAIEIERISEGQRFMTRVMSERGAASGPPATPDVNSASGREAAPPPRALGAGPIEPIPVAQRQAVKQSVTPR